MENKDLIIAKLTALVAKLEKRVAELERRLGLDSSNSSKPPSSDGLRKKPASQSLRPKGEKKSGGQVGHEGATLKQVENPDQIITHKISTCISCNADLGPITARVAKRQVFDIPPLKVHVIEHQAEIKICACGKKNVAIFPENVAAPVQYGPGVQAIATYLQHQQFIPEDRLKEVFGDLFNLPISTATLTKIATEFAESCKDFVEQAGQYLVQAVVKNGDETGFRIGGKTCWLHSLSDSLATLYTPKLKRGAVPQKLTGIIVHDHFGPYFGIEGVKHALCNAHHLRELKALVEIEGEQWADHMSKLLLMANRVVRGKEPFSQEFIASVSRMYDVIVADGIAFHEAQESLEKPIRGRIKRRIGHNLLLRLQKFKTETLRFLIDPDVPFTNNQAEQDIRMMKVKQKISGGFRTFQGAVTFCTIRSFFSTARKQGKNIMAAILSVYGGQFKWSFV